MYVNSPSLSSSTGTSLSNSPCANTLHQGQESDLQSIVATKHYERYVSNSEWPQNIISCYLRNRWPIFLISNSSLKSERGLGLSVGRQEYLKIRICRFIVVNIYCFSTIIKYFDDRFQLYPMRWSDFLMGKYWGLKAQVGQIWQVTMQVTVVLRDAISQATL